MVNLYLQLRKVRRLCSSAHYFPAWSLPAGNVVMEENFRVR